MEPEKIGWTPLLRSFLNKLTFFSQDTITLINGLFDHFVPPLLKFVRKDCKELAPTTDIGLVNSLINLLNCNFDSFRHKTKEDNELTVKVSHLQGWMLFSLLWSIGGSLDSASQMKYEIQCRTLVSSFLTPDFIIPIPPSRSLYDHIFESLEDEWKPWIGTIGNIPVPVDCAFDDILIPTKETARYNYLMKTMIIHGIPFILVGPTGTGKSKYINNILLTGIPSKKYQPLFINFSARTTANQVQDVVMSKIDKRRKGVFGPPIGNTF
jgi:dynein heavy chain